MPESLGDMGLADYTDCHIQCTTFFTCRLPTPETLPKHGVLGCLLEKSREHQVIQASNQTNPVPLSRLVSALFPVQGYKTSSRIF